MEFNFDEFVAWVGEDTDTLMMLIWIIPVIIFVFYGQRIQLIISSNEIKNRLEQLRALDNGIKINVGLAKSSSIGVDTEEDYVAIKKIMEYKSE